MLVVTRYRVLQADAAGFREQARVALAALAARPGCRTVTLGRAGDDPELWTLTSTWASVGDYRRALSSHPVKLHAVPLMYSSIDEPSAYEELITWDPASGLREHPSDLER